MIATMPTAVVGVMPTAVTIVSAAVTVTATMPAVTATMPAVTATMPAVTAPGVSLARHRQARERDCHAADQARKFHEGMSHEEIQAQPPGASGMRETALADSYRVHYSIRGGGRDATVQAESSLRRAAWSGHDSWRGGHQRASRQVLEIAALRRALRWNSALLTTLQHRLRPARESAGAITVALKSLQNVLPLRSAALKRAGAGHILEDALLTIRSATISFLLF